MLKKVRKPLRSVLSLIFAAEFVLCMVAAAKTENTSENKTIPAFEEIYSESDTIVSIPERISFMLENSFPSGSCAEKIITPDTRAKVDFVIPYYVSGITITEEERDLLLYVLDTEVRKPSVKHKIIITEVILNRVACPVFKYANTVWDVLTAPDQFVTVPAYLRDHSGFVPSEAAVTALDTVMNDMALDYAHGALYFCNPYIANGVSWFETSLKPLFDFEGHRYYTYPFY